MYNWSFKRTRTQSELIIFINRVPLNLALGCMKMNTWQLSKLCNALITNTVSSEKVPSSALSAIESVRKKAGGLWVGGRIVANSKEIRFSANAMNKMVHENLEDIRIDMSDVLSVRREFGWVTGIVVVTHRQGELRFRCFGAKEFAAKLSSNL